MNAEAVRRRIPPADIEHLCETVSRGASLKPVLSVMIGQVADGYGDSWRRVVDAAPCAAEIAETIIGAIVARESAIRHSRAEGFFELSEVFVGEPLPAARAAVALDRTAWVSDARVAGRLAGKRAEDIDPLLLADGNIISTALALAVAECLDAESHEGCDSLLHLEPFMDEGSDIVRKEWERSLARHLSRMAAFARLSGFGLPESQVRACVEAVVRTGRAMQGDRPFEEIFLLGALALEELSDARGEKPARVLHAAELGAMAMAATYGFSVKRKPAPALRPEHSFAPVEALSDFDRYDPDHDFTFVAFGLIPLRFTWGELAPLVILTVPAACARLEKRGASPKSDSSSSRRNRMLAESVMSAFAEYSEEMSFGKALGIREVSPDEGELVDGSALYRAAPVGKYRSVLMTHGRGGREMRLHAVADEDGRLVGYAGADPLSEEFHGAPERYVYDLEGWRRGRLVDGIYRKGRPRVKMLTAPEGIEIFNA